MLECLIMVTTILVVEKQMRESILTEFLKRGYAIGQNLAALNANYIATFNYVSIEQAVAKVTEENDLEYAAVQFFDGEVAAFGGAEVYKKLIFREDVNTAALSAADELVQYLRFEDFADRICDITTPVYLKDKKWATVRIGMSMKYIRDAVHKTRITLLTLGALILLVSGVLSIFLARRISRPVGALVKSVEAITGGDYDCDIEIRSNDEIGFLGNRFSYMQKALKENIALLKDSNSALTLHNQRLQGLFIASQAINSLQDNQYPYQLIIDSAMEATGSSAGFLTVVDDDRQLRTVAQKSRNGHDPILHIARAALEERQTLLLQDPFQSYTRVHSCSLNFEPLQEGLKYCSIDMDVIPGHELISVPLRQSDNVKGFINLIRRKRSGKLSDSERQIISVLTSHAAIALDNKKLFLELDKAYFSSIRSLAKSLELKDEYTYGHSERVARVCVDIGRTMALEEKALRVLQNAALLHDIGKIGVIETILNKSGKLDENEFRLIRKHPGFGDEILKPTASLREERAIVRHHHEREDGRGYPDGLTGDQLTLSEKIIIVADAFDAMNSRRPYRKPLTPESIRQELLRHRGTQFDSVVVGAFMEIFDASIGDRGLEGVPDNVVPFRICQT
ncbi:HD domain-containing phosphohydrolase [Desulfococcus sp.]|uniref:HD domain-containing phosphohydrolase n=1 Tax=Desulfococcus sp. TaxID=2025834 RepID=UPI0035944A83